jgi:hypothetical protein
VTRRFFAAVGLALVLSFGFAGVARGVDPPPVPTDPVFGPLVAGVRTDSPVTTPPVARPPRGLSWWPAPIETTGSGLVGTYVGAVGARRYLPAFQYQLIYSDPQGSWSCTAYAFSMALDKSSYGAVQITGRQVRALSGAAPYVGLTLRDGIVASSRLYISVVDKSGEPWANVLTALKAGRGVVLQGDYDQIPDVYSGQSTFDGNHAVYIDYLHSTGLYLYVMDPLRAGGARWVPVSIMRRFAEKLGRAQGISGVYFAVIRPARLFH